MPTVPADSETSYPLRPSSKASRKAALFTTATIVSFSLTLLAAGIGVLTGILPLHMLSFGDRINLGSLLFMMPVLALVLGVCFEVTRVALRADDLPEPRQQRQIRWSPGRNQG